MAFFHARRAKNTRVPIRATTFHDRSFGHQRGIDRERYVMGFVAADIFSELAGESGISLPKSAAFGYSASVKAESTQGHPKEDQGYAGHE